MHIADAQQLKTTFKISSRNVIRLGRVLQLKEVVLLLLQSLQRVLHPARLCRVKKVRRIWIGVAASVRTEPLELRRTVVVVGLVRVVQRVAALRKNIRTGTDANVSVALAANQTVGDKRHLLKTKFIIHLDYLLFRALYVFARLGYGVVYLVEEVIHALAILLLGRHGRDGIQALALLSVAGTLAVNHGRILITSLHYQQLPSNGVRSLILLVAAGPRSWSSRGAAAGVAAAAAPAVAVFAAAVATATVIVGCLAQIVGIVVRLPLPVRVRSAGRCGQNGVESCQRITAHLGIIRWGLLHRHQQKLTQEQAVRGEEPVGAAYLLRLKCNTSILVEELINYNNCSADIWLMDDWSMDGCRWMSQPHMANRVKWLAVIFGEQKWHYF